MGEAHARLVAVQTGASSGPANVGCSSESAAQAAAYAACIGLEAALVVAEQAEVVGLVAAAEAGMRHVLLVLGLLLQRWLRLGLGMEGRVEVSEWIGEVVAWEARAPVRWHRTVCSSWLGHEIMNDEEVMVADGLHLRVCC